MTKQSYTETLQYLYSLLPMYQRQGKEAFKKGMDNINTLCWELGLPQWKFNCIHVAGTNGKGSVSAMLNSVMMEAGFKVGMYTSPHLKSFTERIQLNGKEISENKVVDFVEKVQPIIEKIQPSFFELTVAMAFDYFAREEVDIAIIETGLGGRLDSTNVIRPEVSVITNISMDHTDMLGDTLAAIAGEKAGIIKRYTPVVIGEVLEETRPVFLEKAGIEEAPIFWAEEEFISQDSLQDGLIQEISLLEKPEDEDDEPELRTFQIDQTGYYQKKNLATTLTTLKVMVEDGWEIPEKAIIKGLKKTRTNSNLLGRMQLMSENPSVICDTAHNAAGVSEVMQQLSSMNKNHLHIVWGMVNDKNHGEILALLPKDATYYFVKPDVPRGLEALTLKLKAEAFNLEGGIYDSVAEGVAAAKNQAGTDDLIFIGGSTFVVAEVV